MSSPETNQTDVFISYSHHDERFLQELLRHLKPLRKRQSIAVWADTMLQAGDEWREELRQALTSAKVAIVLVSAHYLASTFIAEEEMPPLLTEAKNKGKRIIQVIVGFCDYHDSELARFQAENSPSQPLSALSPHKRDIVWVDIVKSVKQALASQGEKAQEVAKSQQITDSSQQSKMSSIPVEVPATTPAWMGMGGEQILTYASELDEQGRYSELLEMAIDMNARGLYDLAETVTGHAVNGPSSSYGAWFERAFALAQMNSQEEAILAFKQAYSRISAHLRSRMPTLKLPSGSRAIVFAGAGSGMHYHGMGLVPDAIIALKVAGNSIMTIGKLTKRGTIQRSGREKTVTLIPEMGGNTRWIALAIVLGDGPVLSEDIEPVAGIDRMDVEDIIRWGTLLNDNLEFEEALAFLEKAIEREPYNFDAWFERVYALTALNRKEAYGAFAGAFNERNSRNQRLGYNDVVFEPGVRRSMFAGVGLGRWPHNLGTVPTVVYCLSESGDTALYYPRSDDAEIANIDFVRAPGFGDERWVGLAICEFFDSEDE